MADLIDRDALMADIATSVVFSGRTSRNAEMRGANKIIDRIKAAPTVDAVELVRCKNCRKRHTWECAMHYESDDGKEQYGWENDNDFCSWAERKDGDGNG